MFCSGCGQALAPGQAFCPQCGRPAAPVVPPIPGIEFQLEIFSGKVRALGLIWIAYAALSLVVGIAWLTFANTFLSHHFGGWGYGPWFHGPGPGWFGPALLHLQWAILWVRSGLSAAAGWGLLERSRWARVVAVVAAIFNLLHFPFGTALAIWTLVVLLGYRNSTLYDQLT